jgi:transcriptional regulator with XRE-family HTH domain
MSIKVKVLSVTELQKVYGRVNFGKLLESHRISSEMTQKEFAKLLGISPSSLCDLEKRRKVPSAGRAAKIAKKLKISVKLFIEVALQDQLESEGLGEFKVSVA